MHLHPTKWPILTFDELGMRAKTQEQLKELKRIRLAQKRQAALSRKLASGIKSEVRGTRAP